MATKRKYYNCCFNPFQLEKHGRKSPKNLRRVLPSMIRKLNMKNVSVPEDVRICDYCRLRICKMPEISETGENSSSRVENPQPSTSSVRTSDYGEDSTPAQRSVDVSKENKRLLRSEANPKGKVQKPERKRTSKVFHVEEEIETENDMYDADIIENLTEAFRTTNDRCKKIEILTIFNNWSSTEIREEFDASDRMIAVAKKMAKEHGILSNPNIKMGEKLDEATVKHVVDFYKSDDTSRVTKGEKNRVSVKENGTKMYRQKRLMLNDLKESYRIFKEKYPDLKIGFSKFYELRPKHCVLPGASGTRPVCICTIHENVNLMLDGIRLAQLTANTAQPLNNYKDCLARIMCTPPTSNCHFQACATCPGTANLTEQLEELFEMELRDTVTYQQWLLVEQTDLETIQSPVEEFSEKLGEQLEKLITHDFVFQQQSAFFFERKESLKRGECLVLCDFVENYAFVMQDAIQGLHYSNDRVTLHPFVVYHNEDDTIKQKNYVAISECLKHDATAVHLFQKNFINFLKREIRQVGKIIYFSNGDSGQYRSTKNFVNLCLHEEDFGVSAEWHFFASSHAEGPCQEIGGIIKRLATNSSLEAFQEPINTPLKFFTWAQNNKSIKDIRLEFFTRDDYKREAAALETRFKNTRLVPEIFTFHSIQPISNKELIAKKYSKAQESVTAIVCE